MNIKHPTFSTVLSLNQYLGKNQEELGQRAIFMLRSLFLGFAGEMVAKSFLTAVLNSFIWKVLLKYNIGSGYFSLRVYQTMSNSVSYRV